MKEGIGSFASVSAAFGPAGPIHRRNPGLYVTTAAMPNKSQLAKYSNVIGHVQAYAHARFDQMMIDLEKKLGRQILVKDF